MIIYRELNGQNEYLACCELQKTIFSIGEIDVVPPVFLNLLTRQFPRIGFAIGAFDVADNKMLLVGYVLATTTKVEKSVYGMSFGVLPEYVKQGIGLGLNIAARDLALALGFNTFYCIYEPLEGNLGNLYFDKFGMTGIAYEADERDLDVGAIPNDKILIQWTLNADEVDRKMKREYTKEPLNILLEKHPIAEPDMNTENNQVFIQIPSDFVELKKTDKVKAKAWRLKTRELFRHYLNNKGYVVSDFYTRMVNDKRENYYLLKKLVKEN